MALEVIVETLRRAGSSALAPQCQTQPSESRPGSASSSKSVVGHQGGEEIVETVFDSSGKLLKEKPFKKEQVAEWRQKHGQ